MEEEFMKNYETILKQLSETYPDYTFSYEPDIVCSNEDVRPAIRLRIIIANCTHQFFIFPNTTWEDIARRINIREYQFQDNICAVCRNEAESGMVCHECGNWQCNVCAIGSFRSGKGIITCPSCGETSGHQLSNDFEVEIYAAYVNRKLFSRA